MALQPEIYGQETMMEKMEQQPILHRAFDAATQVSVSALEKIRTGQIVVDIGAGENPGLRGYIEQEGAKYIALDIRSKAARAQAHAGALALQADARNLPLNDKSTDIVHARLVLAHFEQKDRKAIINEAWRSLKPGGKFVTIDYDWQAAHGSPALDELRNFMLDNLKKFDPTYARGVEAELMGEIGEMATITRSHSPSSSLAHNYIAALAWREFILDTLESQKDESLLPKANEIFGNLEREAISPNPPDLHMPNMITHIAEKH